MRNVMIILGVLLLALTLLFYFIHVADPYLTVMAIVGALLIGIGVASWRIP